MVKILIMNLELLPAYLRESNEKDVIKWKNMFHARTSNCIFIFCRTWGILLFSQPNLQQIFFFLLSFFPCINFYNIPLTVFFLLQLYRQCWVSWSHSLSVTAQQLRLLYAHSPPFFTFKFIQKSAFPIKIYVTSYFRTEYFHALDSVLKDKNVFLSWCSMMSPKAK